MKGAGGRGEDVFEYDADSHTTIIPERADVISKEGVILKDYSSADNRQQVCLSLRGFPLYYLSSPSIGTPFP